MMHDDTAQTDFTCRLEWGWRGAERAARRGDLIVVVDVLSFSTTCATAVFRGAAIVPCRSDEEAQAIQGAERGVNRRDVPEKGRFSLSPVSFFDAEPGTVVALPGPNGATCCKIASEGDALIFVGAFVNAQATARAVQTAIETSRAKDVTVLAGGERWTEDTAATGSGDGPLRFALEDFLGAGAILSFLPADFSRSPEARAAQAAFTNAAPDLENQLLMCGSGIELVRKGYENDVRHASRLNIYDTPALLQGGKITAAPG